MREEARIERILNMLKEKWMKNSDSRFGQLMINLGICEDTYNLWSREDDELEEHLKKIK